MEDEIKTVEVAILPIRLGQILKLAEVVLDGNEAKVLIQAGLVTVNGDIETRRGRQLAVGDIITVNEQTFKVIESVGQR